MPDCRRSARGLLCVLIVAGGSHCHAEDPTPWLTGPALKKKLDQPVGIGWTDLPLRDALASLSKSHQVAVLLDRRVDPGAPIDFKLRDISLRQVLEVIARSREMGQCVLDSVVYLGPPPVAQKLRTLSAMKKEELAKLPATRRLELARLRTWQWTDLAQPRDLLAQVGQDAGLKLYDLDKVPYDLWAGASLPALTTTDRLLLVAAQFDLSFDWEEAGSAVRFIPWPQQIALERTYPGGKQADKLAEQLGAALTDCTIKVVGDKVVVRGLLEQHELIEVARSSSKPVIPVAGSLDTTKVEQFKVQNKPVKALLEAFRQQLGLEFRYDAAELKQAGISLDTLISLDLKNVSVDELLKQTLAQVGLTFERNDRVVQLKPKE